MMLTDLAVAIGQLFLKRGIPTAAAAVVSSRINILLTEGDCIISFPAQRTVVDRPTRSEYTEDTVSG